MYLIKSDIPQDMLDGLFRGYMDSEAYDEIRVSLSKLMNSAYRAGWEAAEIYHDIISSDKDIYPSDEEYEKIFDEIENM